MDKYGINRQARPRSSRRLGGDLGPKVSRGDGGRRAARAWAGRGGAGSGCGRRAGRPGPTARLRLLREPRAEAAARRPGGSALGSPGQRRPVSEREGARGPGTRAPGRRLRCVSGLPLGLLGSHAFQKRIRLAPSAVSKR